MNFYTIRGLILLGVLVLFAISILIIKIVWKHSDMSQIKKDKRRPRLFNIYLILLILTLAALGAIEPEKNSKKFDTLEECIKYSFPLKKIDKSYENDISVFVNLCGNRSCIIREVSKEDGKYNYVSWLNPGDAREIKSVDKDDYINVSVRKSIYSNAAIVIVSISKYKEDKVEYDITDSLGSKFLYKTINYKTFIYETHPLIQKYTIIDNFKEPYSVFVDKEEIEVLK